MELSFGFRTEMIFHRFDGIILDRGDYWVIKTPSNPGHFCGNLLLFFKAPQKGSLAIWKRVFQKEFATDPDVRHYTFCWDSPQEGVGDVTELNHAGFKVSHSVVLTAKSVHVPKKGNQEVVIRPLRTEAEWREVTELQILAKVAEYKETDYRAFKEKQFHRYRAMVDERLGLWFGAFLDGRIVGDLGIYKDGVIGRFQSVETHPDFQRQGICGTLVYQSATYAFKNMGISDLVMIADENYHAAKIYESLGFIPTAKEYSALWWDKTQK